MSDVVFDSCVVSKLVLNEEDSVQAEQVAIDVDRRGDRIAVLDFCFVECGNIIWKHFRAGRINAAEASLALKTLTQGTFVVYPAESVLVRSLELAMQYDTPIYDMLFVALVEQLQLNGVSADERLVAKIAGDCPTIKLLRDLHTGA